MLLNYAQKSIKCYYLLVHLKQMFFLASLIDFGFLIAGGRIPDAAMIHAARKRRQKAREMGGDFIPVEDTQK